MLAKKKKSVQTDAVTCPFQTLLYLLLKAFRWFGCLKPTLQFAYVETHMHKHSLNLYMLEKGKSMTIALES